MAAWPGQAITNKPTKVSYKGKKTATLRVGRAKAVQPKAAHPFNDDIPNF
jgi:hypothetical protein